MGIDTAAKVPGPALAEQRTVCGITRGDLAARLGVHRNTLLSWERSPEVDAIRAARYRKALDEMFREAVA
jgi:DNA-binding XRE family transcriptional regulator